MLNTQSRPTQLLVWLAIAAICLEFLWSYFAWPAPDVALVRLLDSELADFAARNQTLIGALAGLGGLAVAYLLNGWRDRVDRRGAVARAERRDGAVLAREAREVADACERAARQLAARTQPAAAAMADLRTSLAPGEHMLLAAPAVDLARLGQGAGAAARSVRLAVRRLGEVLDGAAKDPRDEAARPVAARAVEACFVARGASRVFEALAAGGPAVADKLRLMPGADDAELERLVADGEAGKASRLQSVA